MPSDTAALPSFLARRLETLDPDHAYHEGDEFIAWRRRLLALWRAGLPPHDRAADGEGRGEEVRLRFATGAVAEGRLVLPSGMAPHPAVLLCHEHGGDFGGGWQKLFDGTASHASRRKLYGGRAVAEAFLDAGFAVLCLDALGFGNRQAGGYQGQQALAANAMGLGWSLAGLIAAEDVQAVNWLAGLRAIDSARIGIFGFSFGGFRAWQAAAICSHVAASASLSWMATRLALMRPGAPLLAGHSAFCFLHPTVAARADFPDLAGLAANRPMFLRSGRGDRHMPEDGVAAAWDRIAAISRAAGGPVPDTAFHDAGHTCPPECLDSAVRFLSEKLKQ